MFTIGVLRIISTLGFLVKLIFQLKLQFLFHFLIDLLFLVIQFFFHLRNHNLTFFFHFFQTLFIVLALVYVKKINFFDSEQVLNQFFFFKVNLFIVITIILILNVDLLKLSGTFSQTKQNLLFCGQFFCNFMVCSFHTLNTFLMFERLICTLITYCRQESRVFGLLVRQLLTILFSTNFFPRITNSKQV